MVIVLVIYPRIPPYYALNPKQNPSIPLLYPKTLNTPPYIHTYIHIYIYIYGQVSGVPSPPPPPMVWSGTGWGGGGLACAERGGGRWGCSWRNGQPSQTRPA